MVVGRGHTVAGTSFTATSRPDTEAIVGVGGAECPLPIFISEGGARLAVEECYARLGTPLRPEVECIEGLLRVHMVMRGTTRGARLTLSSGQVITSPVMHVERADGGPATIYYQALRKSQAKPVELAQLNGSGRVTQRVAVPQTYSCTSKVVDTVPGSHRVLAIMRAPNGSKIDFVRKRTKVFGKVEASYRLTFLGGSEVIFAGPLLPGAPLEWEVARVCKPEYGIVFGVLAAGTYRVEVESAAGGAVVMHEVNAPTAARPRAVAVYAVVKAPAHLIVHTASGAVVMRRAIDARFTKAGCPFSE